MDNFHFKENTSYLILLPTSFFYQRNKDIIMLNSKVNPLHSSTENIFCRVFFFNTGTVPAFVAHFSMAPISFQKFSLLSYLLQAGADCSALDSSWAMTPILPSDLPGCTPRLYLPVSIPLNK